VKKHDDLGVLIPEIYLPKPGTNLTKWAVVACDQFTSEPEYWHDVEKLVGDSPSTLNLTFPEVYLEQPGADQRIANIQLSMRSYLDSGLLEPRTGLIYVERTVGSRTRRGLVLALDLERYDYNKGSRSLVRATEGTIVERLPPRMKIREGAALELPHILVLIDDPNRTVVEAAGAAKSKLHKLYDFDLMLGSGHLTGYAVDEALEERIVSALRGLADPKAFAARYGIGADKPVLLFAMGDGNHSLATAKAVWEKLKPHVGMDHPARYALVEIENVHDEGLDFEPIHRVLFGLKKDLMHSLQSFFGKDFGYTQASSAEDMVRRVDTAKGESHCIGLVKGGAPPEYGVIQVSHPSSNLPVGTIQAFLDSFMKDDGAEKLDYVHGSDVVQRLGAQAGNAAFYLPAMSKSALFKTVILDGALPRKTFSMGEAREKRFYMEARKIG
jgi:uncharacterized protein DUF1015